MITHIRTESPFLLMKNGYLETYFSLTEDVKADCYHDGKGDCKVFCCRSDS